VRTSPPPECSECEPYYNLANCDLLARTYIGSRRVVKNKTPLHQIRATLCAICLPKIVSAFVGKTQLDGAAYTLPGSGDEGDSSGNVGQDRAVLAGNARISAPFRSIDET
jgi:hypothetical protein